MKLFVTIMVLLRAVKNLRQWFLYYVTKCLITYILWPDSDKDIKLQTFIVKRLQDFEDKIFGERLFGINPYMAD
jgi:hypothetical protein